ncbi:MAG TPA: hypothetical protein GXX30_09185 [Firmicutes bacterium]|nr:hypothetical protein [Candidatus Fermentithermobacillaceae bacterium]
MNTIINRHKRPSVTCFDAGSEYCPCALAALGECVACSRLRGEEACVCGWSGLCVYQEFLRNQAVPKPGRPEVKASIGRRKDLVLPGDATPRAFILELHLADEIARWCSFPGSFVLVRPPGTRERFNVPVSVMDVRDGQVTLAVEVLGPKTRALEEWSLEGAELLVVAPFWSGLHGFRDLQRYSAGNVLVIAKGMGQVAVPQLARHINHRGGSLKVLLGPGQLGVVFIEEMLEPLPADVEILPKEVDHNLGRVAQELAGTKYDLVVSAGPDIQHRALKGILDRLEDLTGERPGFTWMSNLTMTCAEGICGSCLVSGLRGCKAQVTLQDYLGEDLP